MLFLLQLLKIFVSGKLQDYNEFFEKNSNFVLGLPGELHIRVKLMLLKYVW